MAAFIYNDITSAGLLLVAKGAGGAPIKYTRIVLGDGFLESEQTPRNLSGVVSPQVSIEITKLKVNNDGTAIIGGIFSNKDLNDGFYYRELGLYAEDPDIGEVLYCYGNCGEAAEWIPPTGGATIIEKTIDIITMIGVATNVTAYIRSAANATKEDFDFYHSFVVTAQETANRAMAIAEQATAVAEEARKAVVELTKLITMNTSKVATLWDAVYGQITDNPILITFADINDITLTSGVWNIDLQRLEC
ncbi:MAG: hypothetical protein IJF32_03880 [Oscillospiraceae bacterium]|nr:hypothetical protein [Oscillospiraceae bacterium]